MEAPGNMILVQGDDETKRFLRGESRKVDDWLYEMVDGLVFHAAGRMKEHAPGGIKELVDIDLPEEHGTGFFEGVAGVEPDITEETFHRGLGSDPADYPVFVEVGTGIFGPIGLPISTIPFHKMGPIFDPYTGQEFYATVIEGQKPQHYAEDSFDETVEWTPVLIRAMLPELARRS